MKIDDILLPNEKIILEKDAIAKKGGKRIFLIILLLGISILFFLLEYEKETKTIYFTPIFLIVISISIFIYDYFIKSKKIKGQKYFITNKRAIIYSSKTNDYKMGYLDNFVEFQVGNIKNNIGDVYMKGAIKSVNIKEISKLFNINQKDRNILSFESVYDPYQVIEIIKQQTTNFNQPVYIKKNSKSGWCFYVILIILFLLLSLSNLYNSIKYKINYIKTTAIINKIDIQDINKDNFDENTETKNLKYFVKISYKINNLKYNSIITNDTCYLKSINKKNNTTIECSMYNKYYQKMKVNDKITVYVNPNKLNEAVYVPKLLSNSNLILLICSLIFIIPLISKRKKLIKKT